VDGAAWEHIWDMKIKPTKQPGKVQVELAAADTRLLAESGRAPFRLKKILVPIDFSECSRKALQYALPFARQFDAALTLLYVVEPIPYTGSEHYEMNLPLLEKQMREGAEKNLAELAEKEIGDRARVEKSVRSGRPFAEIINAAETRDIDLIVISTHGHTGLKHVLLGSTAERVVRHAPCPVLVVREQEHEFVAGGPSTA
jgi:nucleotide-binding universal stress UspA family protein